MATCRIAMKDGGSYCFIHRCGAVDLTRKICFVGELRQTTDEAVQDLKDDIDDLKREHGVID